MSAWMLVQWGLLALVLPFAVYFLRIVRLGKAPFAYFIVLAAGYVWAFGEHLGNSIALYWPHEAAFRVALYICYAGMCTLGPASVYLGWCYSGRHRHYLSKARVGILFGAGAFFYIAILTNGWHHWYYTQFSLAGRGYSWLFYLFTAFSYICFAYAFVVMQKTRLDGDAHPSPFFILSFLAPVGANTAGMLLKNPAWDFTPAAYVLMMLSGYLVIWYNRPISLVPIAAQSVVDSMSHPVRVLGPDDEVLYDNGATLPADAVCHTAVHHLEDGNTLMMLTDITAYDQLRRDLETQSLQLAAARRQLTRQAEQLGRQAQTAARLAAGQQRAQIITQLNREVRGKLDQLRDKTETALEEPRPQRLCEGAQLSLEVLEDVRSLVRESRERPGDGF
ncbi:MAG: histidine kinase N-terminal 7TM domain-containing protein [Oscillospiraceae bacterium]